MKRNAVQQRTLQEELPFKRICRFCLADNQQVLENIFTKQINQGNNRNSPSGTTLSIQIMAIASIEVTADDGLPPYICQECSQCFEYSYQFKQMCKKAEHLLRQAPFTGRWPEHLQRPVFNTMEPKMVLKTSNNINNNNNNNNNRNNNNNIRTYGPKRSLVASTYGGTKPNSTSVSGANSTATSTSSGKAAETKTQSLPRIIINGTNSIGGCSLDNSSVTSLSLPAIDLIENEIGNKTLLITLKQAKTTNQPKEQQQQQQPSSSQPSTVTIKKEVKSTAPKRILNTTSAAIQQPMKDETTILMPKTIKTITLSKGQTNGNIRNKEGNNKESVEIDEATINFLNKIENEDELHLDDVQRLINVNHGGSSVASSINLPVTTTTTSSSSQILVDLINGESSSSTTPTTATTTTTTTILTKPDMSAANRPKKLLNKASVRILNKEADKDLEPRLSVPKVKHDDDGNVEIVAEILDVGEPYEHEPDPKDAAPVEVNVFPCPMCERSFPLQQLRDLHVENHKRSRDHQCDTCSKRFYTKYDLQKHIVTHSCEKPYKCVACDKTFARSNLLYRHEKTHIEVPKYICIHCERPFLTAETLAKHVERHNKRRPYQCKLCKKAFAFKQGLERHEVLHSRQQPYPCQYCDLSFSTTSKLARHLTAHAGERPFPCKICSKSYLLSHHFTRHLRSHKNIVESGDVQFHCTQCQEHFRNRNELVQHAVSKHAQDTLICPICNEESTDNEALKHHINLHSYGEVFACEFCDCMFMSAEKQNAHTLLEHEADVLFYTDDEVKQQEARKAAKEVTSSDEGNDEPLSITDENDTSTASTSAQKNDQISQYLQVLDDDIDIPDEPDVSDVPELERKKRNESSVADESKIIDHISINVSSPSCSQDGRKAEKKLEKADNNNSTLQSLRQQVRQTTGLGKSKNVSKNNEENVAAAAQPIKRRRIEGPTNIAKPKDEEEGTVVATKSKSNVPPATTMQSSRNVSATHSKKEVAENAANKYASDQLLKNLPQGITVRKTISSTSTIRTRSSCSQSQQRLNTTDPGPSTSAAFLKRNLSLRGDIGTAQQQQSRNNRVKADNTTIQIIGDKRVKVHKVVVTKAEAIALVRDGHIQCKDGNMILKGNAISFKRTAK